MTSYDSVSILAVFGYILLFMIFISAKKNKIINSFLLVLVASIAWTGGSFLMRILVWPGYRFWYNVSICGLMLLTYAVFCFISSFAGAKQRMSGIWLFLLLAACIANWIWGCFLKAPEIVQQANGKISFEYHMTWWVSVLFGLAAGVLLHMLVVLIANCKNNPVFLQQIEPTILGIAIMFLGNLALLLPSLKGFPIDILAGFVNACLMFYALIRRRMFRLKFLASEGVCYTAALMITLLVFYNFSDGIINFLQSCFPWLEEDYVLVFAVLVLFVSLGFVWIWKKVISAVFIKEEQMQKECLQEFSLAVSKSLRLKDIYKAIVSVIQKATDVEAVYICMQKGPGRPYEMAYADSDLISMRFMLQADNPLITFLREKGEWVFLKDFYYSVEGKAMWEEERRELKHLGIEYAIGLKDSEELVGVLLISNKDGKATISQGDTSFLTAVSSIASIAIKNSMLYEKAYREAITDELTGLYNRRYFSEQFQKMFEDCKDTSLALLLINVDDFKLYNQLYGTGEGDKALKQIAVIMKASVGSNGLIARYSGKEFAVLLPQYDVLGVRTLAENISSQISKINSGKKNYAMKRLTVSAGISAYPYGAKTMKEMLSHVDLAVYYVKRHGKNAIRIADPIGTGGLPAGDTQDSFSPQNIYQEYETTIYALTAAINTKDHYTFSHSNNVAYYATKLAAALGYHEETVEIIRQAALLHDIGKIGIPEHILNKPTRLTEEEYEIMKGHVEASIGIIRHLPSLDYVIPAVIGHHERYDGQGYPRQIAGENIPATARILCIADSFDAIVSKRCYKQPIPLKQARKILEKEAGHQFDPDMVPVFIALLDSGTVTITEEEPAADGL